MPAAPRPAVLFVLETTNPHVKSYPTGETRGLLQAAGYVLVGTETQARANPHSKFFVGPGKLREIARAYQDVPEFVFVVNHSLPASQITNLAGELHHPVIDRDLLILEIFERNARTREAKLQVELAKIAIERAHARAEIQRELKHERQARDYHGPGYGTFSSVKRHYTRQEKQLRDELERIKTQRQTRRKRRLNLPHFSIVGYTNSGKTTLVNAMTGSNLAAEDDVFTTITTTTRRVEVWDPRAATASQGFVPPEVLLLTDTVGFISDLPRDLLDAFMSTLEEIKYSTAIVLVLDIAEPSGVILKKYATCQRILNEIGVNGLPVHVVLNKIDLLDEDALQRKVDRLNLSTPFKTSALRGLNVDTLLVALAREYGARD